MLDMISRLKNLCYVLNTEGEVVDFNEYRKSRLIWSLLTNAGKVVNCDTFEAFMQQADLLEVSIVERLKVEAADGGWKESEAWFRARAFQESVKYLSELPIFSKT